MTTTADLLTRCRAAQAAGMDFPTLWHDVLKPDPCCRLNQELLPVSRFTMTPLLVVVNPSLQVKSLVDYIQLAKQRRGAVTYASHGPGSIAQLVGEWIKTETGTEILEVPYKAVNAELTDLAGGQVMTAFPVPQVVVSAVKSGKLRALAVLGSERINVLPDVPTAKEAGLPGMEALAWNGIADPDETSRYGYHLDHQRSPTEIDFRQMTCDVVRDVVAGTAPSTISARFHNTLVAATVEVVRMAAQSHGDLPVVLTGGCLHISF